ncbi:probable inactive poly [ADP-ribose] polymerase SRO3 [Juglans microcarpa x Juglans regia]|uniref:probable inactive poly [ADP-ribose] polymerase SRO3 n=1 Tax=Juglans microcarpa x Juglans regia TaxID=2249226 RepID=UPI001B7F777C|nr:probable inactive poly [ADP-ribose] polymerase SRO3 [Juglans microcarpa x Juglans regia]XP_040999215.1 probable inactive poly [ADP-ribose] polymerase SRO3 [Juglans microcarpa x Juglans regia]XP_040999216.1 probable inactive poly [ADP-ribose] polymerase SRO3 [Juglans microcarpa x Juglans regia]
MAARTTCPTAVERKMAETIRVRVPLHLSSSSPLVTNRCEHQSDCCSALIGTQNESNFGRSGAPVRFMFYRVDSWIDFPNEVLENIRPSFLEGRPMVESFIGGAKYIFDFLRMLQIDLGSGSRWSIAWIDENDKFFFPKVFVSEDLDTTNENGPVENLGVQKIEIGIRIGGERGKRKGVEHELGPNEDETEVSSSKKRDGDSSKRPRLTTADSETSSWPNAKLLSPGEQAYSVISNLFMAGIRKIDRGATITAVHQCTRTGPLERARLEVFQRQNETTQAARGASNTVYAWYGASAKAVAQVLAHGFSVPSKVSGSETYGIGIYFSPVGFPHLSALESESDDDGQKHVVLCRVILGSVERVEAGSQQCHPSSLDFDTGADNPKNPKRYVVWCTNMNRHILPECVVSYKSSDHVSGQLRGSAKYPFSKLFSRMNKFLPSSKVQAATTLYDTYRARKMARDVFVNRLRSIVGDDMLLSIMQEIHASE